MKREDGQALLLLVAALAVVLIACVALGATAVGAGKRADRQRAADLAALAAAAAMRAAYPRVFEPAVLAGRPNPAHLELAGYLARGRGAALATARRNGAQAAAVSFGAAGGFAPVRVRVHVAGLWAEAELVAAGDVRGGGAGGAGEYRGPFAYRQGRPMRPDVAIVFDRMAAAAAADGVALVIVSAFRSDSEQARLYAAHPDPHWVAAPGRSLHRLATELDLAPPGAYRWLASHAERFHFIRRYSWEPWHYGYGPNPASTAAAGGADGAAARALPAFVPARFAPAILAASQRWSVSAVLLAAQLWQESHFNHGLRDPFAAEAAIGAQAHLMRDLLRRFGAVPLALAAYNAGPERVAACGCVPRIPETLAYVAAILGLLHGAGDPAGAGAEALAVRLVR